MDNVQNHNNFLIYHQHKLLDLVYFQFFDKKSDKYLPTHALNIPVELRMMFSECIVRGTSLLLGQLCRCSVAHISCSRFAL
jgi:hypothetical protein